MSAGSSLRSLLLTPERIPSFLIPPRSPRGRSDRTRLLSDPEDDTVGPASPRGFQLRVPSPRPRQDSQPEMKAGRRRAARSRKRKMTEEERGASESEAEVEIDRRLDQSLETKSRQHNLTTVNVKNIIHVSARARRPRPQRRRCRTQLALWSTGGDHQRARGSHDEGCHQPNRGGAAVS
ncbi:unnamed protein product [Tetraodon nigroviridis]|uniref:(spotted green pufferfish) hypothetical protein n=1 Tax=Tetraodon nigroviridis TaxID=99883 RepID=Q4T341_TETNG|nr:unnamed protein product [Tetraodon nigroviridis]